MSNDSGMFPHDDEGHGSCTGPGCDCDEKGMENLAGEVMGATFGSGLESLQ